MSENYLLILAERGKSFKPLQKKFKELGGFFNGIGYAFPSTSEFSLREIVSSLNINIFKFPLADGQTFESFQQGHKVIFLRDRLFELESKFYEFLQGTKLEEMKCLLNEEIQRLPIADYLKEEILKYREDIEELKNRIQWAEGMEKADLAKEQLQTPYIPLNSMFSLGIRSEGNLIEYYRNLPCGIDLGLKAAEYEILLPSGGYTVFAAPTKHGKTHALVNVSSLAMQRDPSLVVVFITIEELFQPILLRFINLYIEKKLSVSNTNTLQHFYKNFGNQDELKMFTDDFKVKEENVEIFHKNRKHFDEKFLKNGRLRILDHLTVGDELDISERLCSKIKDIKSAIPNARMIVVDYLQLLNVEKPKNLSRDEILKEVCLQLKDVAASTGLAIVTAAQFNRSVQNENDLSSSSIGEGGSIERHASLVIGMWNRTFPQTEGGKKMNVPNKNEIVMKVMLNRHGPSQQIFVAPFDGNIGKIDFPNATCESLQNNNSRVFNNDKDTTTYKELLG